MLGDARRVLTAALALAMALPPVVAQQARLNPGNPSTRADFEAGDQNRESQQRATDLLKALQLSAGDWAADVGAGGGYYSMRLAAMVGPRGKVLAEDIWDPAIRWLDLRVKLFDLDNVEVIQGADDNPKLPQDSLAGVLVVNAYHHFEKYQPMCREILKALKPGGRFVIADYSLPAHRQRPRAEQIRIHEIDPDLVRKELTEAGFRVLTVDDPFVNRMPGAAVTYGPKEADLWRMAAVRPR